MLKAIFGPKNLFLEIQRPGGEDAGQIDGVHVDGEQTDEAQINEGLRALSERSGIALVAVHPVYYLRQEEAQACRVLRKIGSAGKPAEETSDYTPSDSYSEMRWSHESA